MEASNFLLGSLLLLLPLLVAKWYKGCSSKKHLLPPGPWMLPFIGNLHQLVEWKESELLPHRTLAKLALKYGPLMRMKLGERSAIIVSSPQMVREVLRTHDLTFSNRPDLLVGKEIFYNYADMGFCKYNDYWRQIRKICMQELLSQKNIQSFFPKMIDEVFNLVSSIKGAASGGRPINLTETLSLFTNSVICKASVGRACKDQQSLIEMMRTVAGSAGVFNLVDLFPSMKIIHMMSGLNRKLRKMHVDADHLLEDIIIEHESHKWSKDELAEEDIVDVLLRLQKSKDFPIPITRNNIKAIIVDLFAGGSTTTASTMEWAFSELIKNPKVMKKAQEEVREALKRKKRIEHSDIQKLKYIKLVVKETMRFHPLGPLLVPRESRDECEINGYIIPKNTIAIVNFWAISRDPNYWHNPEIFDPERFEESHLDFSGAHDAFIPFGIGRRICPGQSFAMATVELSLALLLYHFDWKLPNGMSPDELDMKEQFASTLERKNNLHLIALPYVPTEK